MPKIKTLTVRRLRGIVETTLEPEGRSVVLLGENGAGKSSFVDALEFFFTGRIAHLEGAQSVSTIRHAPHIHGSRDDTAVEIAFGDPDALVTRTFRDVVGAAGGLGDFIAQGAGASFILRRKNILEFIVAQPAPRYQQLAAIIGLDDLDRVERALIKARDGVERERTALAQQARVGEERLKDALGDVAHDRSELLDALNRRLLAMKVPALISLEEVPERKIAAVAQSRAPAETQRATEVRAALTLARETAAHLRMPDGYAPLQAQVSELQDSAEQLHELLLREVLVSGRRLIAEYDLDTCPICQRPIDASALLALLDERVRRAEAIAERSAVLVEDASTVRAELTHRVAELRQLSAMTTELELPLNRHALEAYAAWLSSVARSLEADPVDMELVSPVEWLATPALSECDQSVRACISTLQTEAERLLPGDEDRSAVELIDLLSRVTDSWRVLEEIRPQLAIKQATYREMVAVCECFISTKRTEVQALYRELEDDIERFFKVLHADEGYEDIRLEVKEGRRGSTEIQMGFHNHEGDPRAFNSEGHLDSLGLCVFLAFVKRFNGSFPLLVLDDVVSSIDAGHRRWICKLLFEEFPDHQLFITTHDYVWFEELCAHQRAFRKGHLFANYQIVDWTMETGPRLDKYRPRWERAHDKLSRGDKDGAAADARKALEAFLFEIVLATQTPVALRRGAKYVVSDLYNPFKSRFRKLVAPVYNGNVAVFQDLETNGIFGNLLVHNNPQAGNASIQEVRGFVAAVQALEALFTCADCGRMVEYHRSANLIKCRCGGITWQTRG